MRNGIHDAVRPGILHRLKQHLKQSKLAWLQLRQCAYDADERVKLATCKRQHEFMFQSKLYRQCFIALAGFPCLFQAAFTRDKHGFGKICLQLAAEQRGVARSEERRVGKEGRSRWSP